MEIDTPEVQEKIKALQEKLGMGEKNNTTPEEGPSPVSGKDVNWDDYELRETIAHLYPKAELRDTADGLKWTVDIDEFHSASKIYNAEGLEKNGTPKGVGDYITYMVNGPEHWKLATILPNGSGMAAMLFQRKARMILPDPIPLNTETGLTPPTDEELVQYEDSAKTWAGVSDDKSESNGQSSETVEAS